MYATRTKDTEQSARLRENYKIVLRKLWKKRDLETLLFLRFAYETGIRGNDILKMDMSCIKGRQVILVESKRGSAYLYHQINGNYPQVSRKTLRIMKALHKKQGNFFCDSREHYIWKIKNLWEQPKFSFYAFRRNRREFELLTLKEQLHKCKK